MPNNFLSNGWVKIAIVAIPLAIGFIYGYGNLTNKVEELQKRVEELQKKTDLTQITVNQNQINTAIILNELVNIKSGLVDIKVEVSRLRK